MLVKIACLVALLSFIVTRWYRAFALKRSLLDLPNARSSHTLPTPRGGGIAILLTALAGMLSLTSALGEMEALLWLTGAAVLLGLVSYWDDLGHVGARWRFAAQILAVIGILMATGGIHRIHLFFDTYSGNGFINALALVALVWLINLYNFMDGINGIAAGMAIAVTSALMVLLTLVQAPYYLFVAPAMLCAACVGFILWNFPVARIFMGDIGSCFIGLVLGFCLLQTGYWNSLFYYLVPILLAPFIVDATFTLVRRGLRGQKIYQAHREHAYQRLAQRLGSHTWVTVAYVVITLGYLLPIAVAVTQGVVADWFGVFLAYFPLILLAAIFRAGSALPRAA